jgi:hypothetical protein
MENPYASPSPSPFSDIAPGMGNMPTPGQYPRGMVGHVRVLGILMIVHGVLQSLTGAMYAAMPAMFPMMAQFNMEEPPDNMPFDPRYFAMGIYIVMSLSGIIPGITGCIAGWKLTRFQGRTLGIASLAISCVSVITCYCSITAIALLVYGLIVLMDRPVKQAFELARQGYLPEQIDALFNPWAAPGKMPNPPGQPFA